MTSLDSFTQKVAANLLGTVGKALVSPVATSAYGAAGGAGVAYTESKLNPGMTHAGLTGLYGLNMLTGFSIGNPWLRKMYRDKGFHVDQNGVGRMVYGDFSPNKLSLGLTGKLLTGASLLYADKVPQMLEQGTKAVGSAAESAAGLQTAITGVPAGKSPVQEAQNTVYRKLLAEGKIPEDALTAREMAKHLGVDPSKVVDMIIEEQNSKGLGGVIRNASQAFDSKEGLPAQINSAIGSGAAKGQEAIDGVMQKIKPISDLAANLNNNGGKYLRNGALAVGGTLAGIGIYNLIRDKLNDSRKAQQDAKNLAARGYKVANWKAWAGRAIGGLAGGGTELALTDGMDPLSRSIGVGLGTIGGLHIGGNVGSGQYRAGAGGFGALKKDLLLQTAAMGSARAMEGVTSGVKALHLHNDQTEHSGLRNAALGAGALATLMALYKGVNAYKRQVDQGPATPVTNVQVDAPVNVAGGGPAGGGGGGGGSSSGSMGTLKVTLPTKSPNDHETQVEMPLEQIGLSNAILGKIRRDTKRRLRTESDARTIRVGEPKPNFLRV